MRCEDRLDAQRHRERERAAGQTFGETDDIVNDDGLVASEARAGAAPAGYHLVGDEEGAVASADCAHLGEHPCGLEEHPSGAAHEQFRSDEHTSELQTLTRIAYNIIILTKQ